MKGYEEVENEEDYDSDEETSLVPFPVTDADFNHFNKYFDDTEKIRGFEHLFEIVLIDPQIESWGEIIEGRGFRKVCRFLNSNSGNFCTMYHKYTGKIGDGYQVFDPTHDSVNLQPLAVSG